MLIYSSDLLAIVLPNAPEGWDYIQVGASMSREYCESVCIQYMVPMGIGVSDDSPVHRRTDTVSRRQNKL